MTNCIRVTVLSGQKTFSATVARIGLLTAIAALALLENSSAQAQFVCTSSGDNKTCTNTGTDAPFTNSTSLGGNAVTTNSGTVNGILITQTNAGGNATTGNSGTVTGGISTLTNAGGNAALTNNGTIIGSATTAAAAGGDVTETNTGTIGGGFAASAGLGNATGTNSGSVGGMSVAAGGAGNAIGTNTGISTAGMQVLASGTGTATGINSGKVTTYVVRTLQGGAATGTNSGTAQSFQVFTQQGGDAIGTNSGSIAQTFSVSTQQGGNATGTNSGAIGQNFQVFTQLGGNATGANSGVAQSVQVETQQGGSATATNSGTDAGDFQVQTFLGGNATGTNSGSVGGNLLVVTSQGGNATGSNSGTVVQDFQVNTTGGNATGINAGKVGGNFLIKANTTGDATGTNSGSVGGGGGFNVTSNVGGNATATNSGTVSSDMQVLSAGGGNASGTNSGFVGGNFLITGTLGGIITGTNSGSVAGNFTVRNQSAPGNVTGTNSGSVGGSFAVRASGGGNATLTNSGDVVGTAQLQGNKATGTNSGTLNSGIILQASVGGSSSLTNSGTIGNNGGPAIQFQGGPDTLTLLQGSKIVGAINLLGANDAVNVNARNQNLTFNTLAGATVNGTVPFVVSGNRIVSFDPNAFGTVNGALMDFTRAVSGLIGDREGAATAAGSGAALGFAAYDDSPSRFEDAFGQVMGYAKAPTEAMVFKNPTVTTPDGTTVWAKGFYGLRTQQADGGPVLRNLTNFYGGAIGADGLMRPDLRVGGFVGGGATRTAIDVTSDTANSDIMFGGGYGRYSMGPAFVDFALLGGYTRNTTARIINNNLSANGMETATANFNGWFMSPEIAYGYRYGFGGNWALTPTARLRYIAANYDGFTETGSTANLSVGSRTLQNFEERGGLTLTQTVTFANAEQLHTNAYVGVLGQQRTGDSGVNAILLGQALAFATPGKSSVVGGYAGFGFDWRTRSGVSFFANAEYTAMSDSSNTITGRGGIRIGF